MTKMTTKNFYNMGPAIDVGHVGTINTTNITKIIPYAQTPDSIDFDVTLPESHFTGREKELKRLDDSLQRFVSSVNNVESLITVVTGLGGIGKTQLVREYVRRNKSKFNDNIIWIDAEKENSIVESFKRLAKDDLCISTMDANGRDKSIKSVVQSVFHFCRNKNVLFIFDNVESMDNIRKFLVLKNPPNDSSTRPYILITSRLEEWCDGIEVVKLNEWQECEAKKFVLALLGDKDDIKDVELLINDLQCFPLVLRQATSYIKNKRVTDNFTISNYRSIYETGKKELLDSKLFQNTVSPYSETTFTTWNITIRTIAEDSECGTVALKIIHTIAYFEPYNIDRESLIDLVIEYAESHVRSLAKYFIHSVGSVVLEVLNVPNSTKSEVRRQKKSVERQEVLKLAVRLLVKYSMISSKYKQSILNIHKVVQDVIKVTLKSERKEEAVLRDALTLVNKFMQRTYYIDHSISVYEHALEYPDLLKEFFDLPNIILMNLIASHRLVQSQLFGNKILEIFKNTFESDHCIIENIKFNIKFAKCLCDGSFFFIQNDSPYLMYEQIYNMRVNEFGENDNDTIRAKFLLGCISLYMRNFTDSFRIFEELYEDDSEKIEFMGRLYHSCISYEESIQQKKKLLTISKSKLSENDPDTLIELNGIRRKLIQQSNITNALHIFNEISDKWHSVGYENQNQDIIHAVRNIESVHFHKNDYETLRKVYSEQVNHLGENHEDTLSTLNDIGVGLLQRKSYIDAIKVFEEIREKDVGLRDGKATGNIRATHSKLGNNKELPIFRKFIVERYKLLNLLKPGVSLLMMTLNGMGRVYMECENYDGAIELFIAIFEKWVELGDDLEIFLDAMHFIAITIENSEESVKILRKVHAARVKYLGENHVHTLLTLHKIGRPLLQLERYTDALEVYKNICDKSSELKDYIGIIIHAMRNIVLIHLELGNIEESLRIYSKVNEERVKVPDENHKNMAIYEIELVRLGQENCTDALEVYTNYFDEKLYNKEVAYSLWMLHKIGYLFLERMNYSGSLHVFDDIYRHYVKVGENNERIFKALDKIRSTYIKLANYEESFELSKTVHAKYTKLFEKNHPITMGVSNDIGIADLRLENYAECLHIFQDACQHINKIRNDDEIIRKASKNVGLIQTKRMRYDEPLHVLMNVYAEYKKLCGEIHPNTLRILKNIDSTLLS